MDPWAGAGRAVYWLAEALAADPGEECPPLEGAVTADVCVVGGGYTGLWTAIELAERDPGLKIVVLEAQGCGFGASGRNGGFALDWWARLSPLVEHFGPEAAGWIVGRTEEAIGHIEEFSRAEGFDCHFRRAGDVTLALSERQIRGWDARDAALAGMPERKIMRRMSAAETARETGSPRGLAGLLDPAAASVQPARLVRGLRRAALRRGVRIYEGTPVTRLERGAGTPVAHTPKGRVSAAEVVLGINAWASRLPELRRSFAVIGTHVLATEPIPERLAGLPIAEGRLFGSAQMSVHYAQVSMDGRIVFGRGLGRGGFGSVSSVHLSDPRSVARLVRDFRWWFPELAEVRIEYAWGGAVDRAPWHLPFAGTLPESPHVHYALGYSGNGVTPSVLMGRILASLATGADDAYSRTPLAGGPPAYLPPDPFLSVGGRAVKRGIELLEERESRGWPVGRATGLLGRLAYATMPRFLEPRLRSGGNPRR